MVQYQNSNVSITEDLQLKSRLQVVAFTAEQRERIGDQWGGIARHMPRHRDQHFVRDDRVSQGSKPREFLQQNCGIGDEIHDHAPSHDSRESR